jgi:hypothetical protein
VQRAHSKHQKRQSIYIHLRQTVRAAQDTEGSFKTSETSEHLDTFETKDRADQGAEGSFKTSSTLEHLDTFETTVRAAHGAEGSYKTSETS